MVKGICTSEIIKYLKAEDKEQKDLHRKACFGRDKTVLSNVYFRGIIEFSNI